MTELIIAITVIFCVIAWTLLRDKPFFDKPGTDEGKGQHLLRTFLTAAARFFRMTAEKSSSRWPRDRT